MEPTLIPARQALQMATINGASLLGLADVGILKEGFKADLIALNLKEPQAAPLFDPRRTWSTQRRRRMSVSLSLTGKCWLKKAALPGWTWRKLLMSATAGRRGLQEGV